MKERRNGVLQFTTLLAALIIASSLVVGCGDGPFKYQVHVQEQGTLKDIASATVIIEGCGAPKNELTDANGVAILSIDAFCRDEPGKLLVKAQGYEPHVENIDLRPISLPDTVQLKLTGQSPDVTPLVSSTTSTVPALTQTPASIYSPTPTPTATPTPMGTSTATPTPKPTDMAMQGNGHRVVLEDFEGQRQMDWWGSTIAVFSYDATTDQAHSGDRSFHVEYYKTEPWQFLAARPPETLSDFGGADAVEVWVFGQVTLLLKLRDAAGMEVEVDTLSAEDPNNWNQLRFDLAELDSKFDLSNIDNLFFFPSPGDVPVNGNLYFDDLALPSIGVVLEDFEGQRQMDWWGSTIAIFSYEETTDRAHSGDRSFRVEYYKTEPWQYLAAKPPADLSDFGRADAVEVWVFGQVTLLLKLRDAAGMEVEVDTLSASDPQGWTFLRFDYTGVDSRFDLSDIDNMFLFPAPGDASATGTIYLDDISRVAEP